MDPSLMREREAFCKRAASAPLVEARKKPVEPEPPKKSHKKARTEKERPPPKEFDYKSSTGSSQYKFQILANIVKYLKGMHQAGVQEAMTIDDILEGSRQTDIGPRHRHWLITEALVNNPKVEVIDEGFRFKPVYNIRDRRGLLNLLKEHHDSGKGCIKMEDVEESLPNVAKVMRDLKDNVIILTRQIDKKQMLYYNNKDYYPPIPVDEDIQKCWRSVSTEGVDERKLEEYLKKHNITAMENLEITKASAQKKKPSKRKSKPFKTHNEHMGDVLKDYSAK